MAHKLINVIIVVSVIFSCSAESAENHIPSSKLNNGFPIELSAEQSISIIQLTSKNPSTTNNFELDFLDDTLTFTGESTRLELTYSSQNFRHSIFNQKTKGSADLITNLKGEPRSIVNSISVSSSAKYNSSELGYSLGVEDHSNKNFNSTIEFNISSLKSKYELQNEFQAGLISSDLTNSKSNKSVNFGYSQSLELPL